MTTDTHLYYRPNLTLDFEERLEDAALGKALHDLFGKALVELHPERPFPEGADPRLCFGRRRKGEDYQHYSYWDDPGFKAGIQRSFAVCDLDQAVLEVQRLHDLGHHAFVKSTRQKHWLSRVERGTSLMDVLGDDMVWSFIDRPDCLMVQQAVEMRYERRFLVMNGSIVTQSPVCWALTPLDNEQRQFECHYHEPDSLSYFSLKPLSERMTDFAQRIADQSGRQDLCIDVALIGEDPWNDPLEVVEFNPLVLGNVGLYACSPVKIAQGIETGMSLEQHANMLRRRSGELRDQPELKLPPEADREDRITTSKDTAFARWMIRENAAAAQAGPEDTEQGDDVSPLVL